MVEMYYFTGMPYAEFPESEAEKYPSMRLTFPNMYFDPQKAHHLFRRYLDEYQYAEEMGFDGLMISEHHNTLSCKIERRIEYVKSRLWEIWRRAARFGGA